MVPFGRYDVVLIYSLPSSGCARQSGLHCQTAEAPAGVASAPCGKADEAHEIMKQRGRTWTPEGELSSFGASHLPEPRRPAAR